MPMIFLILVLLQFVDAWVEEAKQGQTEGQASDTGSEP